MRTVLYLLYGTNASEKYQPLPKSQYARTTQYNAMFSPYDRTSRAFTAVLVMTPFF